MVGWLKGLGGIAQKIKKLWGGGQALGLDVDKAKALEEILIEADLGGHFSENLIQHLQQEAKEPLTYQQAVELVYNMLHQQLQPYCRTLNPAQGPYPWVILFVGANGSGKTTTIAKLAYRWRANHRLRLIAGDTFRAAATEQLQEWGRRLEVDVYSGVRGGDAAGLIFHHVQIAQAGEIVLVDTAGRLPTQVNLMNEAIKIQRVLGKLFPGCPQETLAVLDGTSGQNLRTQAKLFHQALSLTGLIITKLDGGDTLKGGGILGAVEDTKIPLVAVGHGESLKDIDDADPQALAASWVGRE